MKYALVAGGTSGIGEAVANYLSDQGIFTIITGSREHYIVKNNNQVYIQYNQIDLDISEKISSIIHSLNYVFLSAGIFVPDDGNALELSMMQIINHESNISLLHSLYNNGLLTKDSKIIINSSIQSEYPREFSMKYAESKKKLTDDTIMFGKNKGLQLTVIGPSLVKNTPMTNKRIQYYAAKKYDGNIEMLIKDMNLKLSNIFDVLRVVDDIFFSKYEDYQKKFIYKFIPIKA